MHFTDDIVEQERLCDNNKITNQSRLENIKVIQQIWYDYALDHNDPLAVVLKYMIDNGKTPFVTPNSKQILWFQGDKFPSALPKILFDQISKQSPAKFDSYINAVLALKGKL